MTMVDLLVLGGWCLAGACFVVAILSADDEDDWRLL